MEEAAGTAPAQTESDKDLNVTEGVKRTRVGVGTARFIKTSLQIKSGVPGGEGRVREDSKVILLWKRMCSLEMVVVDLFEGKGK